MASIRRRKERGNRFELHYVDVDGRRYRIDTGTPDKKIANLWKQKAEELLSQAKLGIIEKVGRVDINAVAGRERKEPTLTLTAFKDKYLERCRNDLELSPKSLALNRLSLQSLADAVGNKAISELTDEDVVTWKQTMVKQGKTKATAAIYFRHLRAAFNRAVKWSYISSNPILLVQEPKQDVPLKDKDMSCEDVQRMLKAMEEAGDHQFRKYVLFLLYTGCRRNEIIPLKWEDIDLEQQTIKIYAEKTRQRLEIPISKALMRVIQGMEIKKRGFVFQTDSTSRGARNKKQPWSKDYATHHFKEYVKVLGLPNHYTLHSLRHTFTTQLRRKGVPLDIICKLLGHSSPLVTAENYDHSIAIHFREQADLIDFEEG
jgi:site-specific recombinase XerD